MLEREKREETPEDFLSSRSAWSTMLGTVLCHSLLITSEMPDAVKPFRLFSPMNPHPPKWIFSQSH